MKGNGSLACSVHVAEVCVGLSGEGFRFCPDAVELPGLPFRSVDGSLEPRTTVQGLAQRTGWPKLEALGNVKLHSLLLLSLPLRLLLLLLMLSLS